MDEWEVIIAIDKHMKESLLNGNDSINDLIDSLSEKARKDDL